MDQLCRVSIAGGDYETARFYADRLMLLDPSNVGMQVMDANIDLKLGHYAKAITKATAIEGSEDREDVQAIIREAREALKKLASDG